MAKRRQPSGAFFLRLKTYSEPEPTTKVPKKQSSLIRKYKDSDAWLWTEVAAVVIGLAFVIPTAIALWVDLEDRKTQRIAQAWELVTRVAPGNAGKGPALEYLNRQGIPLVGINLSIENNQSPSYLAGVNLSGANLREANLSGADLYEANFSGASIVAANLSEAIFGEANLSGTHLRGTNLSGADLVKADLSGAAIMRANLSRADLFGANLSGTKLYGTNLSGVEFTEVNLSGASFRGANLLQASFKGTNLSGADFAETNLSEVNLSKAENLSQAQLDTTCGDEKTSLPKGLTIKACIDQ